MNVERQLLDEVLTRQLAPSAPVADSIPKKRPRLGVSKMPQRNPLDQLVVLSDVQAEGSTVVRFTRPRKTGLLTKGALGR